MAKPIKEVLEPQAPAGYVELLRCNRGFRRLWLGQVVSQMGDWFDTIALYTIILNLTGSGWDVGLLMVARFVPSFVFGPLSGVIADRFSRRSIMILSDLLRAVVVLGFMFVRRADQLWIIYVLTVLQLGLSTFFEPANDCGDSINRLESRTGCCQRDFVRHLVGDAHPGRRDWRLCSRLVRY